MSNLSELLPSGGGQNVGSFTASGTITNGQLVGLRSDGKVEAITATAEAATTEADFTSTSIWDGSNQSTITSVYDINADRVVQFYASTTSTQYLTGVVSTPTASGLTNFGTPVVINSADSEFISAVYHAAAQKTVVGFRDGGASNYGRAYVITVNPSDNSLTFGAEASFPNSEPVQGISSTYDSTNEKVVFSYMTTTGDFGRGLAGTISGTSVSFGSTSTFGNVGATGQVHYWTSCVYEPNSNSVTVFFARKDQSYHLYCNVGQVAGTSWNTGTDILVDNSFGIQNTNITSVADTNSNKIVVFYSNANNGDGYGVVGTPTYAANVGLATFGTPVEFTATSSSSFNASAMSCAFDSTQNKVVVMFRYNGGDDKPYVSAGTVNGTAITFATQFKLSDTKGICNSLIFVPTINKFVGSYREEPSPYYGKYVLYNVASDNISSFIGLAGQAISDTATGNIDMLGGINSQQTSLTIASKYYIQSNGTLGTTSTSTFVGQAVSATTLNIRDLT
jgi:hypothetical protein